MVPRWVGRVAEIAGVGTLALLVYFLIPLDGKFAEWLAALIVVAAVASLVPLSYRRARQVLVSSQPLLVAAQSLFTAVTLLIVSFASAYYVVGTSHADQIETIETKIDALYFTVTILATVGFGDIHAVGQGARALVIVNMLINVVLVAVAVRLVSWALKQREASVTGRFAPTRRDAPEE